MAFSVNARVKVKDQSSEYRNHLGTVKAVSGSTHQVRLDGFPKAGHNIAFSTGALRTTTLPSPVDYSH